MMGENIQEQTGQVSQNHTDKSTGGTYENNTGNTVNINLKDDQHNTAGNNTNIPQVPEYGSENSQNYTQASTQQNVTTPQHTVLSWNRNEFSENSLNQFSSMVLKPQRPQKNGRVRRNIMRGRNNAQNWEPQDVRLWETLKNHQQSNWWSTNQPDTMSYLQLPPRKFQEQRRHVENYKEEEDLSWCNKCGEPGHIQSFCMARVLCSFCRMRSHSNKACWNQQWNERLEPFSSSRQMTPIQNPVQQEQIHNYGEHRNKQNMTLTNRAETSSRPRENNLVQVNSHEAGLQQESAPHQQVHYQRTLNRDQTNREENILQ